MRIRKVPQEKCACKVKDRLEKYIQSPFRRRVVFFLIMEFEPFETVKVQNLHLMEL